METSTFASVPPINKTKLPFILSQSKIENWLHSLPTEQAYASCTQVLQSLQVLNNKDIAPKKRLMAMKIMGNYLDVFIKPIEKKFIDAGFPLNQEETRYNALIIWTFSELAKGLSLAVSEKKLSADDNAFAIFSGLKALGSALVYISMAYEAPYKGYWQLCFQLYQQAKQLNLLEFEISKNNVFLGTAERIFKQILCFYQCGSNELQTREMKVIYQFLNGYAEKALIRSRITQKQSGYYWAFDTNKDQPPVKQSSADEPLSDQIYFFSAINAAKAIDHDIQEQPVETDIMHSVKISLLNKLLKSLSLTQSRKFTRVKEDKPEFGIMGFNDSVQYIRNNECKSSQEETVITEYDPRIAGIWSAPNLEVLPEGEELVQKMWNTLKTGINHERKINQIFTTRKNITSDGNIWSANDNSGQNDDSIKLAEFTVNNSSINGYSMVLKNGHQVRTNINDLIGFTNNEDDRIEIGLIRRIAKAPHSGINFGIELMALEAQAICISKQHKLQDVFWALFLPGNKALNKPDSIMFSSDIFAPGDFICLHQGVKKTYCRLNKLLHETADISHVELYYPAAASESVSNSFQRV